MKLVEETAIARLNDDFHDSTSTHLERYRRAIISTTKIVKIHRNIEKHAAGRVSYSADDKLKAERSDMGIVAVWLTDDVPKIKDHLPRVQESLKLSRTSWCVYPGEKTGPNEWGINPDADITVIIADGSKVILCRGDRS